MKNIIIFFIVYLTFFIKLDKHSLNSFFPSTNGIDFLISSQLIQFLELFPLIVKKALFPLIFTRTVLFGSLDK